VYGVVPKAPSYAKSSNILLILKFSRTLGYLRICFFVVKCDDIPAKVCLLKYFLMDIVAECIFYVLKAIGNNDFVGGKIPLPITTPFLLLIFTPILYAVSSRANVRIKPSATYATDSNISMVLCLLPSNIKYTQYNVEQIKDLID